MSPNWWNEKENAIRNLFIKSETDSSSKANLERGGGRTTKETDGSSNKSYGQEKQTQIVNFFCCFTSFQLLLLDSISDKIPI